MTSGISLLHRGERRTVFSALAAPLAGALCLAVPAAAPAAGRRCPSGMRSVADRFCVDPYEASTVEVLDGGRTAPHSPFQSVQGLRVKALSRRGVFPQGYIGRNEADRACKLAGKRLCKDDEWIAACRGRTPTRYPYGQDRKDGWCADTNRVSPIDKLYNAPPACDQGDEAACNGKYGFVAMNDPRLNQLPGTLARTGEFARCTNGFRLYDMVGNLSEWTADPQGTFRGGFYLNTKTHGEGCDYIARAHDAHYHDYSTGFRCCADPR